MSPEQIKQYLQYAESEEALPVLFVKKYLPDACDYWIDILEANAPKGYRETKLEFRQVTCALYPRKIHPVYPPNATIKMRRAITWNAAHEDIAQQIRKGVKGTKFELNGYMLPNADGKYQYRFLSALPL